MTDQSWKDIVAAIAIFSALITVLTWIFKPHIKEWVLKILDDNRSYLCGIIDEEYSLAIAQREEMAQTAAINSDRLDATEASMIAQGSRLAQVENVIREVPNFTIAVNKLTMAIERIGDEHRVTRELVARIDERQKMAWPDIERRQGVQDRRDHP